MALNRSNWDGLSSMEKDAVISFLKGNCRIDLETPKRNGDIPSGSYQITDGITSGGHPMKYGEEYRMYVMSDKNCPEFLQRELKVVAPPYAWRIGGNDAIRVIMQYGDLHIGYN